MRWTSPLCFQINSYVSSRHSSVYKCLTKRHVSTFFLISHHQAKHMKCKT